MLGSINVRHGLLVLAHLGLAGVVVSAMLDYRSERRADVEQVREQAQQERAQTRAFDERVDTGEALREGLRQDDPYVVELLLRERLGYQAHPQEVRPPCPPTTPTDSQRRRQLHPCASGRLATMDR